MKKGIIIVSFGTSEVLGLRQNIENIENKFKKEFKEEYKILNAFTSNFVINKLKEKSNISVLSFSEALDNMYDEKIEDITILPLYILPGGQYEGVKKVLHCYKEKFNNIKIAKPLLNGEKNEFQDVILAIKSHLPKDKGIVLVGHGTKDEYNKFYKMLEDNFRENNIDNVYVATVEYGKSNIQLAKELKGLGLNDIYIAPFLIVCGSHVVKDINGDENEKSWKNVFKSQGFNVEVSLKSLGEYDEILDLYIKKIKRILNKDIK